MHCGLMYCTCTHIYLLYSVMQYAARIIAGAILFWAGAGLTAGLVYIPGLVKPSLAVAGLAIFVIVIDWLAAIAIKMLARRGAKF